MTSFSIQRGLPYNVERALRRLLKALPGAPAEIKALAQPAAGLDAPALEQIKNWLYVAWYSALEYPEEPPALAPGRYNLAPALRASTAAATRWEAGWVARRAEPSGICLAGRDDKTRELRPGEYLNLGRKGMPVAPGDRIAVTELLEWVDQPSGFWCARAWVGEPQKPLVRVYFSARADQVGFVLMAATETLDGLRLAYSLKCPAFASAYSRVDTLVIYLEAGAWSHAAAEITSMAKRAKAHLRDASPPLTKKIARGVAFAEDVGSSESFGEHRCRALAPGVLALLQDKRSLSDDGLEQLTESLSAAGIDPARPWLHKASHE